MLELDWDIVWTIVNLLILFLLLKHFLFKPITQMMESRTAEIENNLKDAEEQKQKAQQPVSYTHLHFNRCIRRAGVCLQHD